MLSGSITIRPIKEDDCQNLWVWRNHPDVRRWCFEDREISLTEHKEWFKKAIKDERIYIYIAEDENKSQLGQVRFNISGSSAFINVNLNPEFFGKGLGRRVIKGATKFFLDQRPDIVKIVAEIIEDNLISLKAFQRVGYIVETVGLKKLDKNFMKLVYLVREIR